MFLLFFFSLSCSIVVVRFWVRVQLCMALHLDRWKSDRRFEIGAKEDDAQDSCISSDYSDIEPNGAFRI